MWLPHRWSERFKFGLKKRASAGRFCPTEAQGREADGTMGSIQFGLAPIQSVISGYTAAWTRQSIDNWSLSGWHGYCSDNRSSKRGTMDRLLIIGILLVYTVASYAQGTQPDIAKLKADAQNVVSIIKGDKVKSQTYCQILNLGDELDEVDEQKDRKKAEDLSQKISELEKTLGPEYQALVKDLENMDLTSREGQEIVSIIGGLDNNCKD